MFLEIAHSHISVLNPKTAEFVEQFSVDGATKLSAKSG